MALKEVDIRNASAHGDGVQDDTDAIQQAFNAIGTAYSGVYFSPGVYLVRGLEILQKSDFTIRGCGDGAVIKLIASNSSNVLNVRECQRFGIENIVIDGNRGGNELGTNEELQNGLRLVGCSWFKVSKVRAQDCWMSGIKLGGWSGTGPEAGCSDGSVVQCQVQGTRDQGIGVWRSLKITVAGCTVKDAGWAGISLTRSDHCTVSGNTSVNNVYDVDIWHDGTGIAIEGGVGDTIVGNLCDGNQVTGIRVDQSPNDPQDPVTGYTRWAENCVIAGNVCSGTFRNGQGIYVNRAKGITISGNSCHGNTASGIETSYLSIAVKVVGNRCTQNGGDNIWCKGQSLEICNNTTSGAGVGQSGPKSGILVNECSDGILISGNTSNGNTGNGIDCRSISGVTVDGNITNDNGIRGINVETENTLFGALQYSGGSYTSYLDECRSYAANDVPLLESGIDNAFYFGSDNNFVALTFRIGTPGQGDYALAWEFWENRYTSGSWQPLVGLVDNTDGFKSGGYGLVRWDLPANERWKQRDVNGQNLYWVRARIASGTVTAQPVADRVSPSLEPTDFQITNNKIQSSGEEGMRVKLGHDVSLCNNQIALSGLQGVFVEQSEKVVIQGNGSSNNGRQGILCKTNDYVTIAGNLCNENGEQGIDARGCRFGSIANNSCSSNQYEGIIVMMDNLDDGFTTYPHPADRMAVAGNQVYSNGRVGIDVRGITRSVVSGNSVSDNRDDGIRISRDGDGGVYPCSGVTVTGNSSCNNTGCGIHAMEDTYESLFDHNVAVGNGGTPVDVWGSNQRLYNVT